LFTGVLGCLDQSGKAEEFLKKAQKHYRNGVENAKEWTTLVSKPQNAKEFREAISEGKKKLKKAAEEIELSQENLREIKKLNVPDWRKRHADLLLKVCEKEIEALQVAEEASKELERIMGYVDELEAFSSSFSEAASHFNTLSDYINKEKWSEAKKEAEEAKKKLESAKSSLNKLKELDISGIDGYLKAVDLSIKLAKASSRYADAAKRKDYSTANDAASDIKKYSQDLEKMKLSKLDFNSFIDDSLEPYLNRIDRLAEEAEQLANSADKLYNENVK
jgi:Asp-tRNA(Asn)/Glu-tRNA(Gln) amidotransferase C subunit